ncbi:transporter substrate-binding domain-containing protein [Neorhizobium alkalisoli]|jgi:polar amino acid transport system substrate-binding protein|uniref:Amino acid ABC transporter substrate-binding protein (PAAT family) n=1 Tax=Neorhizobium alkalisoli TaxID=528178 RepID=A0A561R879_9HYPH|nr:transporter substrate-binding domain-containing protein [Neorhizobium alkalisoli]TWF58798.1 amino acid ABC transporter substrate-binding protein (PAAT family) [Neorhizobium alkalisoli]
MVSRREFAGLLGGGAVAAAVVGASASAARAQAAPATGNTFQQIVSSKKLRIGGVPTGAPWTVRDKASGVWGGQFVDIGKALAADMEVELEVVETTWGNAILDLQANKLDVMFGMNPTPKRALAVDFTVPVYNSALTVIAKPGFEPKTWAELNKPEVRIAVDMGSAHDQVASRLCPNATFLRMKTLDEATLALATGRADVQSIFWQGGVKAVKANPRLGTCIAPTPLFGSTSNAAVRRETDKTMRDFLNTWIVYAQGLGIVRQAVLDSLQQVDISLNDLPAGVTF